MCEAALVILPSLAGYQDYSPDVGQSLSQCSCYLSCLLESGWLSCTEISTKVYVPHSSLVSQAGFLRQFKRNTSIQSRHCLLSHLGTGIGNHTCIQPCLFDKWDWGWIPLSNSTGKSCNIAVLHMVWKYWSLLCVCTFSITLESYFILMGGSYSYTDGRSWKHSYHLWSFSRQVTMAASLLRVQKNFNFLADFFF